MRSSFSLLLSITEPLVHTCVIGYCYCYLLTELDATDYNIAVIGNFQEHTARAYLQHELGVDAAVVSDQDWSTVYKVYEQQLNSIAPIFASDELHCSYCVTLSVLCKHTL
jgi:hypothetical protein